MKAKINSEKCDQNLSCTARFVCPFGAISFIDGSSPAVLEDKCQGCGKCVLACPRGAVEMHSFFHA